MAKPNWLRCSAQSSGKLWVSLASESPLGSSPIIEEIEFQLDTNPDLMDSIALTKYGKPKIHRKPYFRLDFTNGSVLYFRPAGAYGAAPSGPCTWAASGSTKEPG